MNSTTNSSQDKHSASPTTDTAVSMPLESVQSSNAPYAAAQPTPHAAMKMQSTLPPIAMAQPLDATNPTPLHLRGGSNISVNPNVSQGIYCSGTKSADPNHPYVTVVAVAPPGASGDNAQVDNMRFAFLQKCRWMAGCLMMYYGSTFLFLQPFVLGTLGLFTAFMGFHSSRSPVDMHRLKWLRWYIRANYVMLCLNMWMLVVTLVFARDVDDTNGGDIASSHAGEYANSSYHDVFKTFNLFMMLLVAVNTVMHVRCLRTAQLLLAELVAAGVDRQPSSALVNATSNPISAV